MRRNTISWNFYGPDIEDHSRIHAFLSEAARLGFAGVHAQLRDYAYQIDQPDVVAAMKYAKDTAHQFGLQFWLNLDPRDAVRSFLDRYPSSRQRTVVPVETVIRESAYELTLDHSRVTSDHKQHCAYVFESIERAFAYRLIKQTKVADEIAAPLFADTGYINFEDRRGELEVIDSATLADITDSAQPVVDVERKIVKVSGRWHPPLPGEWQVLCYVRLVMNTFDYASSEAIEFQRYLFDLYREALGKDLDAVHSDEPGHPYPYHYLTPKNGYFVGQQFYASFATARGYDLRDKIYALVRETSDGEAGRIRCDYYSEWGNALYRFQKEFKNYAIAKFGPHLKVGIHATASEWSAADLQKGTLDYWKLAETTTDGYTDGKHHDRYNAFFHVTLAKSLAKLSDSKIGYTQTWDMFPTAASESYWSDVAATYGLRWEPLGYRELYYAFATTAGGKEQLEERWNNLAQINEKMARLGEVTGEAVAEANLLAIFPLETIMRLGNEEANALRRVSHMLAYHLQAAHYQTDIMTASVLAQGRVSDGKIEIAGHRYDALVYPFPGCMPKEAFQQIERIYCSGGKILLFGCPPSESIEGGDLGAPFADLLGIRPVTRLYDFVDSDPTTPYTGTISFTGELAGVPTVNIREGIFAHVPWHHYFWPIIPTEASPVAMNVRWMPHPIWIGCLRTNENGGKLLYLGFDCTCVVGAERLFDYLLGFLNVPKLVEGSPNMWTSLIRRGDRTVVLGCNRDGLGTFRGRLQALGHTIDVEGAESIVAVAFDSAGAVVDVLAPKAQQIRIDGSDMLSKK